jgi:hypothetical protein
MWSRISFFPGKGEGSNLGESNRVYATCLRYEINAGEPGYDEARTELRR